MNKLKHRNDFIGLVIVFIIFISASVGGLILHAHNQKMAVEQKLKKKQLLELERQIKAIQNHVYRPGNPGMNRKIEPNLMNEEDLRICMDGLKRLAENCDLQVDQNQIHSKPEAMPNYPQYQVAKIKMEVTGDYPRLLNFLEELPRNHNVVRLSSFNIKSEYKRVNGNSGIGYRLKTIMILDLISKNNAD